MKYINEIHSTIKIEEIDLSKILELEKLFNSEIPMDLKELLIEYSSVVFKQKKFIRKINENYNQEMTLEKILSIDEIIVFMENLNDEEEIKNKNLLVFGETLGSPVICIGMRKENFDNIFVFDWDFGITKISNSFNSFINSLM